MYSKTYTEVLAAAARKSSCPKIKIGAASRFRHVCNHLNHCLIHCHSLKEGDLCHKCRQELKSVGVETFVYLENGVVKTIKI